MRKFTIIAALLMLLPLTTQAKTLDELLLDKGVVSGEDMRAGHHDGAKVYWDKGTRLEFPDAGFSARIFTELRARYEFTDNDSGTDNTSSFEVNNVRLGVAGHILNKEFNYFIKAALGTGTQDEVDGADLLDAYITWSPCDLSTLKVGQFKSAIARGYQTDLVRMQFADRSIATDQVSLGRQAGIAASVNVLESLELGAQILNGVEEGINTAGTNTDHTYVLHARMPITGELDSTTEGDYDMTDGLAADIGVAYASSTIGDADLDSISVDANVKSGGFSVHAELLLSELDAGGSGADTTAFYIQTGYFLAPKEFEIAARYGQVDCDSGTVVSGICAGNDDVQEVNLSLNYYWWAHHLKAQLGYSILSQDALVGDDVDSNRWLLQLSSWF